MLPGPGLFTAAAHVTAEAAGFIGAVCAFSSGVCDLPADIKFISISDDVRSRGVVACVDLAAAVGLMGDCDLNCCCISCSLASRFFSSIVSDT